MLPEEFFSRFAQIDIASKSGITPEVLAQVEALADEADLLVRLNEISEIDAEAVWCFRDDCKNTGGQ